MALARFVPLGVAQIVLGLAAIVALWAIGFHVWSQANMRTAERDVVPASPTRPDS